MRIQYSLRSQRSGSKKSKIAKSIDDLVTSQSITGRRDFTDYEILDVKIASALKQILTSVHFRRRARIEEQRAQQYDRFLRGRLVKRYKDAQICSENVCRLTTTKTSTFDGITLYYQQATCLQMWSWKDCTSQSYRTLFSFRPSWLFTIKKPFETMDRHVVYDWRRLQNFMLIR